MPSPHSSDIPFYDLVIIGAGLSGCAFADQLRHTSLSILVVDKSRGTGGRASSKRLEHGSCELGAVQIKLEHKTLEELKARLLANGTIAPWQQGFVGVPRMSTVCRDLLGDTAIQTGARIHHLERNEQGDWLIRDDNYHPIARCRYLVLATPATQAAMLLATTQGQAELLQAAYDASALTVPQWAMWFTMPKKIQQPVLQEFADHRLLQRLVCDSSKPGRSALDGEQIWVAQTRADWSKAHLNSPRDTIKQAIINGVQDHFGTEIFAAGEPHRWLLGQQSGVVSDQPYLVNDTKNLWLIGDWLCQGDGEGALVSATFAAQEFLASL
ncbi:hypothetical protein FJM67_10515 [Maribrevibacterium harenarium]|uniref:Uncharacterized protein n=1 Tax=Maribrevibacterium harenarium TaxID=2589817 RepID=A0A501WK90_9GAMM|nr:NAD(P)-binding protein [Maribrevibacterium harenarium]TPE50273.1 hypothetical protein FJM67_10515 [Maribrevibacterium harenarium]